VESQGMLCSAKELGVSEDASGLLELPEDAPLGESLRDYLDLDDISIEVDLTPNRADCLGLRGIARDLSALYDCEITPPAMRTVFPQVEDSLPIEIEAAEDCPRYIGRVIRNINPKAQTPMWMQERLRRSGLRPISPVVDVTNYVLLEQGQPMHAFDFNTLVGPIGVRRAHEDERLTLLDGSEVKLDPHFLLITDRDQPVALAGLMGGEATAVSDETRNLFLESAYFKPSTIIGRARKLGMTTDAAHRFERGVDPQLQRKAVERATELLLEIVGGVAGPTCEAVAEEHLPQQPMVMLRAARLELLLGMPVPREDVSRILGRLGMEVADTPEGWRVTPPSARFDIAEEVDLIEEVARIYGYDRVPEVVAAGVLPGAHLEERVVELNRARLALVERGYFETVNYAFVSRQQLAPLGEDAGALPLANPLSTDLEVMRTSITPGLMASLVHNQARQHDRVRVFEAGVAFVPDGQGDVREEQRLAGLIWGRPLPERWNAGQRELDYYDIKGDLEALLTLGGMDRGVSFEPGKLSYLHPGQSAEIMRDGQSMGWVGCLHPRWLKAADAKGPVFGFELTQGTLLSARLPEYREISRYPSIRRDIAVIVAETVSWSTIEQLVEETAGNLLTKLVVFDEYRGAGIDEGHKSMAIGLTLQDVTRTLKDEEVDAVVNKVVTRLSDDLNAVLRG
jgi:phenylalanyl-tRNA synthetase beta chain